ncbi:hypothetical protein PSDI105340_14570 [Pseudoalteromonas distincta]
MELVLDWRVRVISISNNPPFQAIVLSDGQNLIVETLSCSAIVKSIKFKQQEMTLGIGDP